MAPGFVGMSYAPEGETLFTWYYDAYEGVMLADHEVYFGADSWSLEFGDSDNNESFITWYEDGWVVALNKYYMAFECECYDDLGLVTGDTLGYILKSTNGDVPFSDSAWDNNPGFSASTYV